MIDTCGRCGLRPVPMTYAETTAEAFWPWVDVDGKVYNGPARQSVRLTCSCGWEKQIERRRGKVVSEVTND